MSDIGREGVTTCNSTSRNLLNYHLVWLVPPLIPLDITSPPPAMSEPLRILAGCLSHLQDASSGTSIFPHTEFPSIICVGSQTAGKSSIIETIVGHSFLPRGEGIVTRCPLKIRWEEEDTRQSSPVWYLPLTLGCIRPRLTWRSCSLPTRSMVCRTQSSTALMRSQRRSNGALTR